MATAIVIVAIGVFAAVIVAGIVAFVSIGIKREERRFARTYRVSLTRPAPDRTTAGARSVSGLYVYRSDPDPDPDTDWREDMFV